MSWARENGRACPPAQSSSGTAALGALLALLACSGAPDTQPPQDGPPRPAAVRDGIGEDVDGQVTTSSLFGNWDAFVDPEGLPVVYEWSAGTVPGEDDLIAWTMVGGARSAGSSGLDLPLGVPLFVNVRASDIHGHRSEVASSDGVVVGAPRVAQPMPPSPEATPRPGTVGDRRPPAAEPKPEPVTQRAELERHDVTWTFARPATCGRFVNGDWWVLGPVDLVAIRPVSLLDGDRVRNGAMSNPSPTSMRQGYDSSMFADGAAGRYDAATNVALGVTREHPLRLAPGTSLVCSVSQTAPAQLPQLESCAVLTCLAEPPPADAFRPPYCGTDKRCRWLAGQLDLTALARLQPVAGAPDLGDLVAHFERTWLDHVPGYTSRYLHPRRNMPDYGRELADLVGAAALALQLDLTNEDKRPLVIALVQLGIDVYGVVHGGGRFVADGGSGSGRKFPLLFAGALLHDAELLQTARSERLAFAEDVQTFYVEQTAPGIYNHGHGGYGPEDVGLPEWGNRHGDDPSLDHKAWTADPYRRCCTANAWAGQVLATRIMGLREAWAHDALFDYVDRYLQVESPGHWMRAWSPFAERMWDRYRMDF
ncbi:MAG: hypothetical protein H6835_09335 [Planctomycetes bacterium]|nr:hypothetical protein [Planctomycetota bacterium]